MGPGNPQLFTQGYQDYQLRTRASFLTTKWCNADQLKRFNGPPNLRAFGHVQSNASLQALFDQSAGLGRPVTFEKMKSAMPPPQPPPERFTPTSSLHFVMERMSDTAAPAPMTSSFLATSLSNRPPFGYPRAVEARNRGAASRAPVGRVGNFGETRRGGPILPRGNYA